MASSASVVRSAPMTAVLLIAVGLSILFAVLKLADSICDIAFEDGAA